MLGALPEVHDRLSAMQPLERLQSAFLCAPGDCHRRRYGNGDLDSDVCLEGGVQDEGCLGRRRAEAAAVRGTGLLGRAGSAVLAGEAGAIVRGAVRPHMDDDHFLKNILPRPDACG